MSTTERLARSLEDSSARVHTGKARGKDIAVHRAASFGSTVVLGGYVATIVTHYFPPPEAIHAAVVGLIIFAVNTTIWLAGYLCTRFFNGRK